MYRGTQTFLVSRGLEFDGQRMCALTAWWRATRGKSARARLTTNVRLQ